MDEISRSSTAGCYKCTRIFNASEIQDTTDDERTALCPYCGIDSVLPETSPFIIDQATLNELNKIWF